MWRLQKTKPINQPKILWKPCQFHNYFPQNVAIVFWKYSDFKRRKPEICPKSFKNLGNFITFSLKMWQLFLEIFQEVPLTMLLGTFSFSKMENFCHKKKSLPPINCKFLPNKVNTLFTTSSQISQCWRSALSNFWLASLAKFGAQFLPSFSSYSFIPWLSSI